MGTPGRNQKPQLTKAILEMKFMKKTKERMEREMENTKDHEELYSNIISDEMKLATGNFIIEPSYQVCEGLIEGRLSFKGMNPEIERLMELERSKNGPQDEIKKDVNDEELVEVMKTYKRQREVNKHRTNHNFKNQDMRAKKRKRDTD